MNTKELIQRVKEAGQSIVDNAESITGDYKYQTEICIYITLDAGNAWVPEIRTEQTFLPEKYMASRRITPVLPSNRESAGGM